ncbi:MAG: universal stress protein [Leptolyngbya sp. BL-A-14]
MFNKILVAIDQSKTHQKVFKHAVDLAQATGAKLMLLHVLSAEESTAPRLPTLTTLEYYPMDGKYFEDYQERWQSYEKLGLELLRSCVEKAMAMGVTAEFTQSAGTPGRAICELAATWDADLIILGRRGHSGLNELILGSVSNYVLHNAPCSVLTVQGNTNGDTDAPSEKHMATAS